KFIPVPRYTKTYKKPSTSILTKPAKVKSISQQEIDQLCQQLEERLVSFQIHGKVVKATIGPRLTLFEFMPDAGVKISKIVSLSNDLALVLGASSIRILAPIPGKTTVGI